MKLTRRPSLTLGSLASSLGAQLMRHPLGRRKPREQRGVMSLVPVGHGTGEMILGS